jgi:exodeoxyribonuclease V alpha subunit
VLDVEAELNARFAIRGGQPPQDGRQPKRLPVGSSGGWMPVRPRRTPSWPATGGCGGGRRGRGEQDQHAGRRPQLLERQGRRLVVTLTLKAAKVARAEVGAVAGSAASLVVAYGWHWDVHGEWTRLAAARPTR